MQEPRPKLCGSTQTRLMLQVSYRSSESDHNHIFLIYSYILFIVVAISHIRGIQRPLLSQSKRQRSQLKTHRTYNWTQFHVTFQHYYSLLHGLYILPWLIVEDERRPAVRGQRHFIPPFNRSMIHVSINLKHSWVYDELCAGKKSPGLVLCISAFKME